MKSWPTLVPLRHARFYAPKEEVFVTCCQLACKGGVFAARTIIPFSGLILSQHLRRWNWQRFGASPKIISRERSTPVCCPNYKTNSMGAFFWENPKTDLWSQIIRILHYQKNGRSEKGSFTMTTACPRTPRGKKKTTTTNWSSQWRQEEKATWATNEYTKCIYFGLKHKRFSNRIHSFV